MFSSMLSKGFNFYFTQAGFFQISIIIVMFALLKPGEFKKGLILSISLVLGYLVSILLLGFGIFESEQGEWLSFIPISTILFAFWNFNYKGNLEYSSKKGDINSRYLLIFILGLINGAFIFISNLPTLSVINFIDVIPGFGLGLLLGIIAFLIIELILLFLMVNFIRIKQQTWMLIQTAFGLGFTIAIFLSN